MAISLKRRTEQRPTPDSMTLIEHLTELRTRVLTCAVAFVIAATIAFLFYPSILSFLQHPYCEIKPPHGCHFYITGPLDGLALRIKIAAYGGMFLASPVLLFEFWRFITPGLKPNEKRYAIPFVVASIALFALGCAVAFFTFPHALRWLDSIGGPSLTEIFNPIQYLSLIILLMVVFGLTFEFPVVLVSLELARVVTPARLLRSWRWAVISIVIVAAVFTPSSDPFSMFALAIPLVVFYFLSIGIGKLLGR